MTDLFRGILVSVGAYVTGRAVLAPFWEAQPAHALSYLLGLLAFLLAVGGAAAWRRWARGEAEPPLHGPARYWRFSVDHKVIGVQYLVISFVVFFVAGSMALVMRAELARPGLQYLSDNGYHTAMGLHGIGMIVVALTAIIGGLGNFAVPLQIGAADMAFPRLNAVAFWMLPPAVLVLLSAPFAGGFDFGWTAYPPLSEQGPLGRLSFFLAFLTVGFSSVFAGVNFLTTILTMRAKGMTLRRIPVFAWGVLAAGIIIVMATSVVASSLLMVVFDRIIGASFFNANRGGAPILYQHLFWFYSHPAVYIMILPAMGVVLEILPPFTRKPLFAYDVVVAGFLAIVGLSFIVWAHHLWTSGMWDLLSLPFMVTTELISVPTGAVFLSALGTLWCGRIRIKAPMLFALGFLANFLVGGLTGIFHADVPTGLHLHDTWFVVAHFHYTIMGGTIFALFAGLYYWFPKITGRMPDERLARVHFWLMFVGFHLTFIPMFWMGTRGMRRRVADILPEHAGVQTFVSLSALLIAASAVVGLWNIVRSARRGPRAGANPWGSRTLEWTTASPPPEHNFDRPPVVTEPPYQYGG